MAEEAETAIQRGQLKDAFANFRQLRLMVPRFRVHVTDSS